MRGRRSAILNQFDQHVAGGLRVKKRHQVPSGAGSRRAVHQSNALSFQSPERRLQVGHAVGEVVKSGAPSLQMARDRGIGRARLEKLEVRSAGGQELHAHALTGHLLDIRRGGREQGTEAADRGLQRRDGDPDVIQWKH